MLQEPMMEKMTAMRLLGMVDALKAQEQDPTAHEASFLERLARRAAGLRSSRPRKSFKPQPLLPAKRSTFSPARWSGFTPPLTEGRLCRRDRLSRISRARQERHPNAGAKVGMGGES